ncbi:MAG: TfoX/Sxy family protein [Candidatus Doudnabacteria bacterium]|nr:TfoX/Sxy family protein [Candidatus Doudnabacteria bacterium]
MSSFESYILEQLSSLNIKGRRMFDAYGLYLDGKFFAIIYQDQLFFKTNEQTRKDYEAFGSKPFAPSPKQILKNYYEVPPEIIDDLVKLKEWARLSLAVIY